MRKLLYILLTGLITVSCNDFLDVAPDTRTQLDSYDKIRSLLVTGYPTANYSLLCELSSDNAFDNQYPINGISLNVGAFNRMDTEIYEWQDVKSATDAEDTPYQVWEAFYHSVAVANHALEAINDLRRRGSSDNYNPLRGEALLLRAYSHFILVNIFSKAYIDSDSSALDLGIPYITEPIDYVGAVADRVSVAEVYNLIQKDIEEGLPLIDDNIYSQPKYHFTNAAANAFASQFYLYKREYEKAIACADAVLGTGDPTAMLRNWATATNLNPETESYAYISIDEAANLLIIPTYSVFFRRFMNSRYAWNLYARAGVDDIGPTWSNRPPFFQGWLWTYDQSYGAFNAKALEFFEYTDKVAGVGYAHCVRVEFTTDDCLLNRAEAKAMLGRLNEALTDLQYWNASHKSTTPLTASLILSFYTTSKPYFVFPFHLSDLSKTITVSAAIKPYIDCCLHFRRLERLHEGHRWFDLKRYGIDVTHYAGKNGNKLVLKYNDEHRAIQIPADVVQAGIEPNPRINTANDATISPFEYIENNFEENEK